MGFRALFSEGVGLNSLICTHSYLCTLLFHYTMDQLNISSFDREEDSEVDCECSLIVNSESGGDSDSGLDNETPSDLDPSDSSTTFSHCPKCDGSSHAHNSYYTRIALKPPRIAETA